MYIGIHLRTHPWTYTDLQCVWRHGWEGMEPLLSYNLSWSSYDLPLFTIPANVTSLQELEFAFLGAVDSLPHIYWANVAQTSDQMNTWRWDNLRAFWDQADYSNPQTTSSSKVKLTSERFSWYGRDYLTATIEPPSCRHYKQRDFLSVSHLNCDEIIDADRADENWADFGAPCYG